jgi:hypothetical protein
MRSEPLRNTCTRVFGIIEKDEVGGPYLFPVLDSLFSLSPSSRWGFIGDPEADFYGRGRSRWGFLQQAWFEQGITVGRFRQCNCAKVVGSF